MALNPSGPISIGGSTVGQSINLELGLASNATSSVGQASFRALANVPSGAIALSKFYGKSNVFSMNVTGTNVNLRTLALASGWNGTAKVSATIQTGVLINSSSVGSAALVIDGAWPGGVELTNNGTIRGAGGAGGNGGNAPYASAQPAAAGNGGGTALSISSPVTIYNNQTIAGGGGGGGGGGSATQFIGRTGTAAAGGGGGGGGAGLNSPPGAAGGAGGTASGAGNPRPGNAGSAGTATTGGAGGTGTSWVVGGYTNLRGGTGGTGGALGSGGANGDPHFQGNPINSSGARGLGGAAGPATVGNSLVTWGATGTRLGPLN